MVERHCIDCGAVVTDRPGVLCAACAMADDRPIAPRALGHPPHADPRTPVMTPLPVAAGTRIRSNMLNRVVMFFLLLICGFMVLFLIIGLQATRKDESDTSSGSSHAGNGSAAGPAAARPPASGTTARSPASPADSPSQPEYVYTPLTPYPYDHSIRPATESIIHDGVAPGTDEEIRQFAEQNPNSPMAKAQEFYVREDGQRRWRYTEAVPVEPKVELQEMSIRMTGTDGRFEGSLIFRNRGSFPVMDVAITLMAEDRAIVLVPPSRPGKAVAIAGQGVQYRFSGDVGQANKLASARVKVEAQIDGPPGLVVTETALPSTPSGSR
jgi:hypothetical protein